MSRFGDNRSPRQCTLCRGPDFLLRDAVNLLEPAGNPLDVSKSPS